MQPERVCRYRLRRHHLFALTILLSALAPRGASAAFDEFSDGFSPKHFELRAQYLTLVLKGEVELELHDLEGRGGPGYDSVTDTRTLGTRSPFVEIDTFWLAPRLVFENGMAVYSILEFTPRGAGVTAVWFDGRHRWPQALEHHVEVGFHTPFVKIDRRTERYPLIGSAYWRQPEIHIVYEGLYEIDEDISVELGLSAALMRPIAFFPVQDGNSHRGSINVVGYGAARPFSGNAPVWGAKLQLQAYGVSATGFAYLGRLASEAGTDELRNNFGNYGALEGGPDADLDRTFYWYGGRIAYDAHGAHFVAELINSQESLLRRWGAYIQASYEMNYLPLGTLLHTIEPVVRYEVYRIRGAGESNAEGVALRSPAPSQAVTWDYEIVTAGLVLMVYRDLVRARVEYAWVREKNGVPSLGIADEPLKNDELLVQLELRF